MYLIEYLFQLNQIKYVIYVFQYVQSVTDEYIVFFLIHVVQFLFVKDYIPINGYKIVFHVSIYFYI